MLIVKEHKTPGSADELAPIRVYNTLAKAKQPLETVVPGKVGI
jgi:hypothetical protein